MSDKQTPKTFEEVVDAIRSVWVTWAIDSELIRFGRMIWNARDTEINELKEGIKKKDQLLLYYHEGCDCTREEGCFKCRCYKRLNGDKDE